MFKTFQTLLAIQTATMINLLVYFVRKLPWVPKLIPSRFYGNFRLKKKLATLVRILILAAGFAVSFAYVGLILYLPVVLFGEMLSAEEKLQQFVHQFFLISFVVAGVSSAIILEPKRKKYVAIKLMRMSPEAYMKMTLVYKYVLFFVYLLPGMLWFGSLLGASLPKLILLTLSATMMRVVWEYIHLKLFEKTGKILIKLVGIVWLIIAIGFAAAYLPLYYQQTYVTGSLLLTYPVMLLMIAAGLLAVVKLARYPDYRKLTDAATKRDDPLLDLGRMMTEANKASVATKDTDILLNPDSEQLRSKKGYAYLNALFFARHRRLIRRPLNIRLMISGLLGLVGVLGCIVFEPLKELISEHVGNKLPVLVLVMFNLTVGERICRAIFFNCDLSLLHYPFYRNEASQHFRVRLMKLIGQNILIAFVLGVSLTVIFAAAGLSLLSQDLFMLWLCLLALAVFFSTHHLFLYYILQPYTTELNIKNPFFTIVSLMIGAICGISLFIRVPAVLFALLALGFTVAYVFVASMVVRKFGHITFRLK